MVVAGVVALVLAWLAAPDVARQPVAVPVGPADVAAPDVAAVLVAAGAAVVLAVQASWAWPGVPAGLGVFAEQVAPGERGALVALAAPAELAAPVPGAPAGLAWVEEPAGRCVLPVPAFLPEEAVMERD